MSDTETIELTVSRFTQSNSVLNLLFLSILELLIFVVKQHTYLTNIFDTRS